MLLYSENFHSSIDRLSALFNHHLLSVAEAPSCCWFKGLLHLWIISRQSYKIFLFISVRFCIGNVRTSGWGCCHKRRWRSNRRTSVPMFTMFIFHWFHSTTSWMIFYFWLAFMFEIAQHTHIFQYYYSFDKHK